VKKVIELSWEEDNSEIHQEYHKQKMGKGNIKKKAFIEEEGKKIKVKIKPKCSK
jgi:hypothetical protein